MPTRDKNSVDAGDRAETPAAHLPAWVWAALLLLATIVLYWPATRCAFINFDDLDYVTANSWVQKGLTWGGVHSAFSEMVSANWHPLTMLSHMLDCQLFGLNPWGHHLTNILLHACNSVLVFVLLRQLTGATGKSLCVAALFACHPLRVESVAWVAERKDVLSSFFGLGSLLFYARYARDQARQAGITLRTPIGSIGNAAAPVVAYFLSLLCLALGLLSKPMLVTWPFVMLLLDFWPLGRLTPGSGRRVCAEKIPFLALVLASSAVTFVVQSHYGAMSAEHLPFAARAGNALVSYCRYVGKFFWPTDLALPYPHPGHWPAAVLLTAGMCFGVISTAAWMMRRRHPYLLVGWLWYCGTLVPVIGFVQVGVQSMADRYSYLPSVGLLIALVWGAGELIQRQRALAWPLSAGGFIAIALCCLATRQQLGYWMDSEKLFGHAIAVTQNNYYAYYNLGNALLSKGQVEGAVRQFQQAIEAKPDFGAGHNNLGNALRMKGDYSGAVSEFEVAVQLDPEVAERHYNLGATLLNQPKLFEAIHEFQQAVRLKPLVAQFRDSLGAALSRSGDGPAALEQFREAVRLRPDDATLHQKLGIMFDRQGQFIPAVSEYREAVRCQPNDFLTHHLLGLALGEIGKSDEAIFQLQEAIRLQPADASLHNDLGNAFDTVGRSEASIFQYREALRLEPDNAPAHGNLGAALGKQGKLDQAVTELQEAVRLRSDDPLACYNLGMAQCQKGQTNEAVIQLARALKLKPDFEAARNALKQFQTP